MPVLSCTCLVLHPGGDVEGDFGSRAAGSPSNVTEDRAIGNHALLTLKEILDALHRGGRSPDRSI